MTTLSLSRPWGAVLSLLLSLHSLPWIVATFASGVGHVGRAVSIGCGTWLCRTMANDAEAGGGLQVATIQLAITLGASGGGMLFDSVGWWSPFVLSALPLMGSSIAANATRLYWELSK